MYAVPAAPGPTIAATCGTTPLMITCSRKRCPEPANIAPGGLLHARAGGVDEPHHRDALGQRQLAQARDLLLAGHADRAALDGEVVRAHRHQAPVDLAEAGDDAVGGRLVAVHRALGEVRATVDAELDERAVVEEQREALARGQLALVVLAVDLLLAPRRARSARGAPPGPRRAGAAGWTVRCGHQRILTARRAGSKQSYCLLCGHAAGASKSVSDLSTAARASRRTR